MKPVTNNVYASSGSHLDLSLILSKKAKKIHKKGKTQKFTDLW